MRFLDRILSDMEMRIIANGYTVQGVLSDPNNVAWTYTIGLSKSFDLPELVITNLDNHDAVVLLTWVIEELRDGASLDDFDDFQAVRVHADHLDGDLLNMWREYYGEEPSTVDVVQLQLGAELACPCCASTQVDLSDPKASTGTGGRLNRAQRRARKRQRQR